MERKNDQEKKCNNFHANNSNCYICCNNNKGFI